MKMVFGILTRIHGDSMKIITEEAKPIAMFAGSIILKSIAYNDHLLSSISIVLIFITASMMGLNILKMSDPHFRRKCALSELLFCVIMWILVQFLNPIIGNILVSLLCAATTHIYVYIFCPKILGRTLTIE